MKMTRKQFDKAIIAQDDDCDYQESGWLALVFQGIAYLAHYSHDSCYGTFEALGGEYAWDDRGKLYELVWDWEGTPKRLVHMAKQGMDPAMPSRRLASEDYDVDHLLKVYERVLEWAKRGQD